MFPILAPMAIGAIGGALMNKKKPLNGALLGAGLGAGAGAAFPAMGGLLGGAAGTGEAASAATPWADGAGAIVAPAAGSGSGVIGGLPTQPGLLSQANTALQTYKPIMDAAAIGLQASGALDQQQPQMQAPEVQQMQGGTQTLAQIAGQGGAAQMQGDQMERQRRRMMMRGGV